MKFLLQERRLSEEHLDAIWAATEKPDQFEAVSLYSTSFPSYSGISAETHKACTKPALTKLPS